MEQSPISYQHELYPQSPKQSGGEYRQVPPEVSETYKKLGFLPLRSTVESLGLRVKFNPEHKTSTIYDPENRSKYFTVPSIVAYGVAFAAQDVLAAAVKHIRSEGTQKDSTLAESRSAPESVVLPPEETTLPEQAQTVEATTTAPVPQWPVEATNQRAHMVQALQPETTAQHGFPGRLPTADILRMQALQHMLSKTHRDIGAWWK